MRLTFFCTTWVLTAAVPIARAEQPGTIEIDTQGVARQAGPALLHSRHAQWRHSISRVPAREERLER